VKPGRRRASRALALLGLLLIGAASARASGVDDAMRAAAALSAAGDDAGAVAVLEQVLAGAPADPAPYNELAILLVRRGELERARDLLDAALRTDPAYADVYDNLQAVLGALAARAYARALDDPGTSPAGTLELASVAPGQDRARTGDSFAVPVTGAPAAPTTLPDEPRAGTTSGPALEPPLVTLLEQARPAPMSEVSDGDRAPDPVRVETAVRGWARAWSAQDVDAYLDFYSDRFRPGRGLTLEAWRDQRRARLSGPAFIEVALDDVEVRLDGHGGAHVRFEQTYRSDRLRSTVVKVLELARDHGEWRILSERVR